MTQSKEFVTPFHFPGILLFLISTTLRKNKMHKGDLNQTIQTYLPEAFFCKIFDGGVGCEKISRVHHFGHSFVFIQ